MNNKFLNNFKSTFLAVLFFGVMICFSATVAKAQSDTINPLFSTTGPNVLGAGHLQWNTSLDYYHLTRESFSNSFPTIRSNGYGLSSGLRFGVGDRAELTFDVGGAYNTFDTTYFHNTTGVTPAVGAKLLLYEGKGWLPMTAFFTHVSLPVLQNAFSGKRFYRVQPEIGFQFRNTLGSKYVIDYSLGVAWNNASDAWNDPNSLAQYSLYFRKLVSSRHTFGVGFDNNNAAHAFEGCFEALWQATDNLQLQAKIGISAGVGRDSFADNISGLIGVSWMIW